jgi:hypothetical protein
MDLVQAQEQFASLIASRSGRTADDFDVGWSSSGTASDRPPARQ